MDEYIIQRSTLDGIADAINSVTGESTPLSPANMAAKVTTELVKPSGKKTITDTTEQDVSAYATAQVVDADLVAENIKKDVEILGVTGTFEGSGGGASEVESGVIFIDYDGTIVESWESADVAGKTALPDNPSHDRLVAQGWNWTLADIQNYVSGYPEAKVVVGQMYKTASGLTEFDITLTKVTGLTVTCNMSGNKTWGDGTSDNRTIHTYADYGDYTITCDGTSVPSYVLGDNSTNGKYISTGVFLGENVTSIGGNAFDNRHSLMSITISDSVTSIGSYAFYFCSSLNSITIPDSVTSIGDYAFYYCSSLTSIAIPNSVTSISTYVFSSCYSLNSITIPDSVTSISTYVFSSCFSLTSITIPNSVTSIGSFVFQNCYSLTSITISENVTSISNYAFVNCYSLNSITIPDSVTSIGDYAFYYCRSLTSITIPDSVTSIGGYAFEECYSLISITISDSVTSIGSRAFYYCYSLKSITIPDSVTSIGSRAFYSCIAIIKYDFTAATAVPTLGDTYVFDSINGICKIIVPDALYNDWIVATNWATYADYIHKASEVTD